jgi:hypothetical protein
VDEIERGGTGVLASPAPYVFAISNILIAALVLGTLWQLGSWRPGALTSAAAPKAPVTTL